MWNEFFNYQDIVLTREKYNEVYVLENNPLQEKQRNFIRQLLESYTIIMLGYSLQDSEIVQLIANRKNVENYKKVIVIIDTCNAKAISNKSKLFLRVAPHTLHTASEDLFVRIRISLRFDIQFQPPFSIIIIPIKESSF